MPKFPQFGDKYEFINPTSWTNPRKNFLKVHRGTSNQTTENQR